MLAFPLGLHLVAGLVLELLTLAVITLVLAVLTLVAITLLLTAIAEVLLPVPLPVTVAALPLRAPPCDRGNVCVLAAVDLAIIS